MNGQWSIPPGAVWAVRNDRPARRESDNPANGHTLAEPWEVTSPQASLPTTAIESGNACESPRAGAAPPQPHEGHDPDGRPDAAGQCGGRAHRHHRFTEQRRGVAALLVCAVVIVGALAAGVGQHGFDLGDLGGGQVEKAIDDFVDVPLDPLDCGIVAGCGRLGGTFRELRESGFAALCPNVATSSSPGRAPRAMITPRTPTTFRLSAQGCEARATLGTRSMNSSTPTGLHQLPSRCDATPSGLKMS